MRVIELWLIRLSLEIVRLRSKDFTEEDKRGICPAVLDEQIFAMSCGHNMLEKARAVGKKRGADKMDVDSQGCKFEFVLSLL